MHVGALCLPLFDLSTLGIAGRFLPSEPRALSLLRPRLITYGAWGRVKVAGLGRQKTNLQDTVLKEV